MIKGLLFDLNGTLIDIYTSETDEQIYRTVSNFFDYFNIKISPSMLKEEYFTVLKRQKQESMEEFPEFDVVKLFDEITKKYGFDELEPNLPPEYNKIQEMIKMAQNKINSINSLLFVLGLKSSIFCTKKVS